MSNDRDSAAAQRLGVALKLAQHTLRLSMDVALRPLLLTTPQYAVLTAVDAEEGISSARLAKAAFVSAQTMHGLIANLERDGLLERVPDPTHGRVLKSRLTANGRRKLEQAHRALGVVEARLLQAFGAAAADRMATALTKLAQQMRDLTEE